jgi:hypothetical protein
MPEDQTQPLPLSDWKSIGALAERLNAGASTPTLTEHSLRHHVRLAEHNGLSPAIRRVGRRVLISESRFLQWLESRPSTWSAEDPLSAEAA